MDYTIGELNNKYSELKNTIEENNKKIKNIKIDIEEFEEVINMISTHGDITNQIRMCDEQISELKTFGNLKETEIKELQEKREFMSSIKEYLNSLNSLDSKEQQIETLNRESEKLKNQIKDLEKINTKQENIMNNLKEVCKEKQEELNEINEKNNNEIENTKRDNITITKNCRPLTVEMRKIEERLKELEELVFLTKSQKQEKENLKQRQIEITKSFSKTIPNTYEKEILTSNEMFNSYILNKEQYNNKSVKKDLEKINNLIDEIENFTKEKPIIEQPIIEKEEEKQEPKEKTLAEVIEEYQNVRKEIEDLTKNNSTDLNRWVDLLQKQNELELEMKKRADEFNKKLEEKEETEKETEEIIKEPLEQTEREKLEQQNRKIFDDIISRRKLNDNDKYDMNSSNKENTNKFLDDVQKLYEQKQEKDYENAKKMLENDKSMTLENLRKKLIMEIDEATVNKVIDRFEKEQKIDNPLTEEQIAKMKQIEQKVNEELEKEQLSNNTLTEDKIKEMNKIAESVDNVVDIKADDRIYQKRIQEHEQELNEIYDNKEENVPDEELNKYLFDSENPVVPEITEEPKISKYEMKKIKARENLINELSNKQEIEKKVKRKTTKEKYIEIRKKIGAKIANFKNNADKFLNRGPENVDELEERMGRAR